MAAPDYPVNVYELILEAAISGKVVTNRLYYEVNTEAGAGQSAYDVATGFATSLLPLWKAATSVQLSYQRIYCRYAKKELKIPHVIYMDNYKGDIMEDALPGNIALLIQIRQRSFEGKHNGRLYFYGAPEEALSNGALDNTWAGTYLLPIVAALQTGLTGPSGTTYRLGVMMLRRFNEPLNPAIFLQTTGVMQTPVVHTQRRRTTRLQTLA